MIPLLVFVAGRCLVPMDETDLFFNLRLGELVLHDHHVPTHNLLSFTYPDATDVNLAWLFQIVLALAHRAGGIAGTVVLKTAFVAGTFAVLYRVARTRGAHPAAAALALALAAWAAEPRFVERPHLVTFLGLSLLLLALERAERGRPRALWLLVPSGLVWANANSCFFLAPAVLALYAAGARLEGRRQEAGRALVVAMALVPLMFATPSGLGCLGYITNHLRMPWLRPLQEYRHASWPVDGPFFFLAAAMIAAAVARRVPPRWGLPIAALALLGALRIRFVAEFALLAGPALAVAATPLVARVRFARAGAAAALVALAVLPRLRAPFNLDMEAGLVPLAAVDFAEREGLRGRMYNDLEVGSYLSWRGWPRYRVFQDPRINGYPEELHAILRRADLDRRQWQALLDRFAVDAALVSYPDVNPRAALFDPALWALVYRDGEALVFTRRLPARQDLVAREELPLTFGYRADSGTTVLPLAEQPAGSPVAGCEWRRRLGELQRALGNLPAALAAFQAALDAPCPDAASTRRALGALALRLGEPARALAALADLPDLEACTNRGFALLSLGRAADALAELDAVLAAAPASDEATFGRGLALQALGRKSDAAAAFAALLARSPAHPAAAAARERLRALR